VTKVVPIPIAIEPRVLPTWELPLPMAIWKAVLPEQSLVLTPEPLPVTHAPATITSARLLPPAVSSKHAATMGASRTDVDALPRPRASSCATFHVPVLSFHTRRNALLNEPMSAPLLDSTDWAQTRLGPRARLHAKVWLTIGQMAEVFGECVSGANRVCQVRGAFFLVAPARFASTPTQAAWMLRLPHTCATNQQGYPQRRWISHRLAYPPAG
jgi:hypothetical protein